MSLEERWKARLLPSHAPIPEIRLSGSFALPCCGVAVSVIATCRLTKRYGRRLGIDDVSLEIPEGEIFGFLGPNGAGKTTAIRLLLGFLRPSGGRATIFDLDTWHDSPRIKRDVGYLPGDLRLYPWMSAKTAMGILSRVRETDLVRAGVDLADRFRLETNLPVRKMSRGTRQKLGLLLAMVHRPRLLVLDEPTSGLDPLMRQELAALLRELASEGRTVFFSSHTLSEVEQLCDRVAIVREGRIVADETLQSLRSRARRVVTLVFDDAEAAKGIEPPDFLPAMDRSGDTWLCELTGPVPPLIHWIADHPIADVTIGHPDLEHLFREYYRSSEEKA